MLKELKDNYLELYKQAGSPENPRMSFNCRLLSIPLFLILLDDVSDAESLDRELGHIYIKQVLVLYVLINDFYCYSTNQPNNKIYNYGYMKNDFLFDVLEKNLSFFLCFISH